MSYVCFSNNILEILSTIQRTVDKVRFSAIIFFTLIFIFQLQWWVSKHFYIPLSIQLVFALTYFNPQIFNYLIIPFALCQVSILLTISKWIMECQLSSDKHSNKFKFIKINFTSFPWHKVY